VLPDEKGNAACVVGASRAVRKGAGGVVAVGPAEPWPYTNGAKWAGGVCARDKGRLDSARDQKLFEHDPPAIAIAHSRTPAARKQPWVATSIARVFGPSTCGPNSGSVKHSAFERLRSASACIRVLFRILCRAKFDGHPGTSPDTMRDLDKALADIGAIRSQLAAGTAFRGYGPATIAATSGIALTTAILQG